MVSAQPSWRPSRSIGFSEESRTRRFPSPSLGRFSLINAAGDLSILAVLQTGSGSSTTMGSGLALRQMAIIELSHGAADRGVVGALVIGDGFHAAAALLVGVDKCLIWRESSGGASGDMVKGAGELDPQWSGHTVTSWCIDRVCTRISSACPAGKSRLQPTFVVMQDLTP